MLFICLRILGSYSREDTWEPIENETQMYKRMYPCRNFVFLRDFDAYTSEEDKLQVGQPLVNEPGQNVCLENESEYVFPIRKSRDRSQKINRRGRNLINFSKKEWLLIMNGRLGYFVWAILRVIVGLARV